MHYAKRLFSRFFYVLTKFLVSHYQHFIKTHGHTVCISANHTYICIATTKYNTMNTASQTVAKEILNQLGGNRFIAMTGSKNFGSTEKSLSMHLTKNNAGAKYLEIILDESDTYTMIFSTSKKVMDPAIGIKVDTLVITNTVKGVYNDVLQFMFTGITGLCTSL